MKYPSVLAVFLVLLPVPAHAADVFKSVQFYGQTNMIYEQSSGLGVTAWASMRFANIDPTFLFLGIGPSLTKKDEHGRVLHSFDITLGVNAYTSYDVAGSPSWDFAPVIDLHASGCIEKLFLYANPEWGDMFGANHNLSLYGLAAYMFFDGMFMFGLETEDLMMKGVSDVFSMGPALIVPVGEKVLFAVSVLFSNEALIPGLSKPDALFQIRLFLLDY